nr:unnamed protein product [Callosobruchus analis]
MDCLIQYTPRRLT